MIKEAPRPADSRRTFPRPSNDPSKTPKTHQEPRKTPPRPRQNIPRQPQVPLKTLPSAPPRGALFSSLSDNLSGTLPFLQPFSARQDLGGDSKAVPPFKARHTPAPRARVLIHPNIVTFASRSPRLAFTSPYIASASSLHRLYSAFASLSAPQTVSTSPLLPHFCHALPSLCLCITFA